jgi:uncharacterized protein
MDIPVELSRILITELGDSQVIFLKEREGERTFPIVIGISEALAIDRRLKGVQTPRPMTHDLLAGVIRALGGELKKIVINDLREHTFIARLIIRQGEELIEVDSRPSDAIALGAALQTPLFVAEHVMDSVTRAEPTTKEERIALLEQRRDALSEQITAIAEMLDDEEFIEATPDPILKEHRQQLEAMKNEYEAIDTILRKLG